MFDGWTMDASQVHRNWEDRKEYAAALVLAERFALDNEVISRALWMIDVETQAEDHADLLDTQGCAH